MTKTHYIACYGDSLIQGFPFSSAYSWVTVAEKEAGGAFRMLNYGLCGDATDDILYRMRQYDLPDYVHNALFLGGANDIIQGRKCESILRTLEQVYATSKEKKLRLAFVLPFISTERALNAMLESLRASIVERFSARAFILDLQPAIGLTAGDRYKAYVDGIHPKAATYEAMGRYAAPLLAKWLAEGAEGQEDAR